MIVESCRPARFPSGQLGAEILSRRSYPDSATGTLVPKHKEKIPRFAVLSMQPWGGQFPQNEEPKHSVRGGQFWTNCLVPEQDATPEPLFGKLKVK